MLEIIENAVPLVYLDLMHQTAMNQNAWHFRYPHGRPDKHPKLEVIDGEPLQPVLAGMAMGLLTLIYDKNPNLFLPAVSYCGIGMKNRHRPDNKHIDHEKDLDYIKVGGVLNSDWGPQDGGSFEYGDEVIPCKPGTFLVFDPRVEHKATEITSDKVRIFIDFAVPAIKE
jgi:hypothetical protein|tara:strand:+ start:2280 stop:2786 length:507 start_codon:yes stop_codon:yes gene_type:complete